MITLKNRPLPDNTPIIIGAAQHVERLHQDARPPFNSPMQLAAAASRAALQDANIAPVEIDAIAAIRLFSDSAKVWASPFGGSNNPPESVAQRIGATPTQRIYSNAGGTEPLQVMVELLQAIARGQTKMALLTGAEAVANQRFAVRNNFACDWHEEFDAPLDNREYLKRLASMEELKNGLRLPVHFYAIIENIQAHQMGHDRRQHTQYMAELMAPFSAIAAANPYSQSPVVFSAEQLMDTGPDNYSISLPYSKRLVAQDAVNQASALLFTSVGNARRLGVDPQKWVFLESYAEGVDHYLTQRIDPGRSTAMELVLRGALDKSTSTLSDINLIDIYSCFPCAVHAACEVLDLPTDGSRPLTITGGLPFFGGPGNNYSAHALAEAAVRLRGKASRALITANGGFLSKHAAAILTSDPAAGASVDWENGEVLTIDSDNIPQRAYIDQPHSGEIISYTVISRRDKPDIGVVLAETPSNQRFIASSTDLSITSWMENNSPIGRAIETREMDERQIFNFRTG